MKPLIKYIIAAVAIGWFSPFAWWVTSLITLLAFAIINFITYTRRQAVLEKEAKVFMDIITECLGPSMSDISPENQGHISTSIRILQTICKELHNDRIRDYVSKIDYIWTMQGDEIAKVMDKIAKADQIHAQ